MNYFFSKIIPLAVITLFLLNIPTEGWALASNNIPLDSPIYSYLDKLVAFGLVDTDFKGIRPYSKAEAARVVAEAEGNLGKLDGSSLTFAEKLIQQLKELLPREIALRKEPAKAPFFDYNPMAGARLRYVYVDGLPRSYERPVHDPGGDGVFGIGSGLRPDNPYPFPVQQHGTEGTPLLENNEGIVYRPGHNAEFRFNGEAYLKSFATALVEPLFLYSSGDDSTQLLLNRGYLKLGGGGLELEVGRDANWLGLGYRGAITMTNNARNLDIVKISSPEPVSSRYLWDLKYALIVSRLDDTGIGEGKRHPYFLAWKLSFLPDPCVEFGINVGKEFGGPGVNNSLSSYLKGIIGGSNADNANNLAGLELRWRMPFLRNTEIYGEFSGEDSASFWPIVESYVAGIFIPRLSADGKDDLRFEYFLGNQILYTSGTFPAGYLYRGMPIGHSQGGATEEFFVRYSHWFSPRNRLALEYFHTERGNSGRVPVNDSGQFSLDGVKQAVERKNSVRAFWYLPLYHDLDLQMMYGWERIHNMNLREGVRQTNQIFKLDLSYRY
ncbi:MAG TPA: capsule assembly Wzi family protein [Geobacteraceae bacterium]|nr:capsule assembly Wzi family protein [Geobacteraceae bacterium]